MQRLSRLQEHLLNAMMGISCLLVLAMMLIITGDVVLRNLGLQGIPWSNEVSEDILYLVTLMTGPCLLRQGRHIRVDIVLRVLPPRRAWQLEWVGDLLGLACCLYFVWYGAKVTIASYLTAAVSIRTLVMPEWWLAGTSAGYLPVVCRRVHFPHPPPGTRRAGCTLGGGVGIMRARCAGARAPRSGDRSSLRCSPRRSGPGGRP